MQEERRFGRYLLHEPIGRGAMGRVYRAEDPAIHRAVAVKVLHAGHDVSARQMGIARERFRREAQAAGKIDHPHIVRIFDVGEEPSTGEMYIVMEYLSGSSLEQMIQQDGLSLDQAVDVIGQVAAGLDAAHEHGLVHRDVKPSNVLFTQGGTAKIVDFGITLVESSALTQDMTALGTPAYMSPEQVSGKTLDARADLFSLGVLSYEILTGQKPFTGTDAISIAFSIAHTDAAPISEANPQLPRALDDVFERMLAKDPAERYGSGQEFHEALSLCLTDAAVARASKSKPWWHSARVLWSAGGAVALLIAAVGLGTLSNAERTTPPPPPAPNPVAAKPVTAKPAPVPTVPVTISLTHRMRQGRLVVMLDGAPILAEGFTKAKLAFSQTTTWDAVKAPAGKHKLRAKVTSGEGIVYLSDPVPVEILRNKAMGVRIRLKGDKVTLEPGPG